MMTVTDWKKHIEADIRQNVSKYLNPELQKLHEESFKALSLATLGSQIQLTFAPDEKIQSYLDGKPMAADICCLVCIKLPFGIKQCSVPHNGPCNMCG